MEYAATPAGLERAQLHAKAAPSRAVDYVVRVVGWARRQSFAQLVKAVYERFPEYRQNSIFHG